MKRQRVEQELIEMEEQLKQRLLTLKGLNKISSFIDFIYLLGYDV